MVLALVQVVTDEARAVDGQFVLVDAIAMDVAHEGRAGVLGRGSAALVDLHAGVGGAVVLVVVDVFEEVVGVGPTGDAALADVDAAGDDVPEVFDNAGGDEEVAARVPVDAPLVGDAVGELVDGVVGGVVAHDAGVELHGRAARGARGR